MKRDIREKRAERMVNVKDMPGFLSLFSLFSIINEFSPVSSDLIRTFMLRHQVIMTVQATG